MKTEEQRIAIAEACGWKPPGHPDREAACDAPSTHFQQGELRWVADANNWWLRPGGSLAGVDCMPDYLNDLNALHEAEKVLSVNQRIEYWKRLTNDESSIWDGYHATAAQRAEGFLRTLNLWTD